MKVYAITSSLSAYLPERAILMSERVRANSIQPYINTVQIKRVTNPINNSIVRMAQVERLHNPMNKKGERFTPLESARKSPFRNNFE
jgi:hypothetical protein